MLKIAISLLLINLFITGCSTIFDRGVEWNFPSDISGMCYHARNESKIALHSVGLTNFKEHSLKVIKVNGERKFSGSWGWKDQYWGQYVLGLCNGSTIWIGSHPHTGGEVNPEVLKHEFGHYWLINNYNDYGHNNQYSHLFYNWRDISPRQIQISGICNKEDMVATSETEFRMMIKSANDFLEDGEVFSATLDNDGVKTTYDFIVVK